MSTYLTAALALVAGAAVLYRVIANHDDGRKPLRTGDTNHADIGTDQ